MAPDAWRFAFINNLLAGIADDVCPGRDRPAVVRIVSLPGNASAREPASG